jgi:hypothetical protein
MSRYIRNNNSFINYIANENSRISSEKNHIYSLAVDGESLWIGTGEGLDILNTKTNNGRHFPPMSGIVTAFRLKL